MNTLQGSFTLIFKDKIPDQARILPHVETDEEKLSVTVPYASVTPRARSVEFKINNESFSFEKTILQVINSKGEIVFNNTTKEETAYE